MDCCALPLKTEQNNQPGQRIWLRQLVVSALKMLNNIFNWVLEWKNYRMKRSLNQYSCVLHWINHKFGLNFYWYWTTFSRLRVVTLWPILGIYCFQNNKNKNRINLDFYVITCMLSMLRLSDLTFSNPAKLIRVDISYTYVSIYVRQGVISCATAGRR